MSTKLTVSNKEVWQIAYPIIFGNLAQTIIVFVNTMFLGHVGNAELGAAMMAGLYYLVFTTITQGFSVGIQIMVARRLGEGNVDRIGKVFEHGFYFTMVLGLVLLGFMHFFTDEIFNLIIKSPNIYDSAIRFMDFRQWGIIFVSANYLFRSFYIGLSNTKIITWTTLAMAVVNIFFDYSLIFGHFGFPHMGVAGAGLSSVLAEISAVIIFFIYTFAKIPCKKYNLFTFSKFDPQLLKSVLKISLPTMFQRLISFGSWFLFFTLIEHLGEEQMAISGIVRSVYMLCTISVFAYAATANTITSRLIGADKISEIPRTLLRIVKLSMLTLCSILVIFVLFPKQIAMLYTDDALMAVKAVPVMYVIFIAAVIMTVSMIYFEFISGTGNTFVALILETAVLVCYVAYIATATHLLHFKLQWVWCSEWVYSILLLIMSLCYYKRWIRKQ